MWFGSIANRKETRSGAWPLGASARQPGLGGRGDVGRHYAVLRPTCKAGRARMAPCSLPCSEAFLKQVLKAAVITDDGTRPVITDDGTAAIATVRLAGGAHRHTAARHSAAVVADDRHWLPRNGEPAAITEPLSFGCAPCNESQREAEC